MFDVLEHANLFIYPFPLLWEVLKDIKIDEKIKRSKLKLNQQLFFCIRLYDVWKHYKAIYIILTKLQNKYKLKWLQILMFYYWFPNIQETFQGDLKPKLWKGLTCRILRPSHTIVSKPQKWTGSASINLNTIVLW